MSNEISTEMQKAFDELRPLALSLPAEAVRAPEMPIDKFIAEGRAYVAAGHEQQDALFAIGMPEDLIDLFAWRLTGLQTAELIWGRTRNKGRDESALALIHDACELRGEALAMSDLALRNSLDGQRRLANIREGEGLADTIADLLDLSLLLSDAGDLYRAIKADPAEWSERLARTAKSLQEMLAQEHAEKTLSIDKELRDRFYTLCLEPLREMRAFAAFAFRKDKDNNRRFIFSSAYLRKRIRRYRSEQRTTPHIAGTVAGSIPGTVTD